MIRGITPIDSACEMMGLHQAQALTHFIFLETWGGRIIFIVGFILSLVNGLRKGSFRTTAVFVGIFLVLWFLFVAVRVKSSDPVSAMERHGYKGSTASLILKENGYQQVMVVPVMDISLRLIDAWIAGAGFVLDHVDAKRGYFSSPFLMIKTALLIDHRLHQGLFDPHLQMRVAYFYQDHFWPVLRTYVMDADWPGNVQVASHYKEEVRKEWQVLRDDLYTFVDHDGVVTKMFERFYGGKVDKDAIVRELLKKEMALRAQRYTQKTYMKEGDLHEAMPKDDLTRLGLRFFEAVPFIHGGMLLLVLSIFPYCLAGVMLSGHSQLLLIWASIFFSVKAWTLGWVVMEKISQVWFAACYAGQGLFLWQAPWVSIVVAAGIILSAVIISGGLFFMTYQQTRRGT